MKYLRIIFLILILFTTAGCSSYYTLRRTPQRRTIPSRRQTESRQQRQQPGPRRQQQDVSFFDVIFRRNPQNFSSNSHLSEAEREALRRSDISQDPAVREIHNRGNRSQGERSDWVFGTRNGSYF